MRKITVYTKNFCGYCTRAKELLSRNGIAFEEINLEDKLDEILKLKERTGWMTFPQIFIGDEMIGGYAELRALDAQGKLKV